MTMRNGIINISCKLFFVTILTCALLFAQMLLSGRAALASGKSSRRAANTSGVYRVSNNALITGINTGLFFARLGAGKPIHTSIAPLGLDYEFVGKTAKTSSYIRLGVYPSVEEATRAYKEGIKHAARIYDDHPPTGIGDAILYPVGGPGTLWLRRANVILIQEWKGSRAQAIAYAKKVDNIFLYAKDICPRGAAVAIPDVELDAPKQVALGDTVPIKFRVKGSALVCAENGRNGLHAAGYILYSAKQPGNQRLELTFASATNVLFRKAVNLAVVPRAKLRHRDTPHPRMRFGGWFQERMR